MLHIVLCQHGSYVRQRLPSPVQTRAVRNSGQTAFLHYLLLKATGEMCGR